MDNSSTDTTTGDNTATSTTNKGNKTPKAVRPLTRKQAAFVRHLVDNPKASATQAVQATYGKPDKPVNRNTASVIATENLSKPSVRLELEKYASTAELVMLEVLEQSRERMTEDKARSVDWANTARQTADSILDRVHGKATQRVEQASTSVTINIDLTAE